MNDNLFKIINLMGYTPYQVAKATGISNVSFSGWKSGRNKPKLENLKLIADFLGVDVTILIDDLNIADDKKNHPNIEGDKLNDIHEIIDLLSELPKERIKDVHQYIQYLRYLEKENG